mmetsp:Transcript_62844/g.138303  ORF Transcript_62844/g.138303 Transcript_62844/m.138303 type:complete len:372 (+) Transcript_62844:387-1502(+)
MSKAAPEARFRWTPASHACHPSLMSCTRAVTAPLPSKDPSCTVNRPSRWASLAQGIAAYSALTSPIAMGSWLRDEWPNSSRALWTILAEAAAVGGASDSGGGGAGTGGSGAVGDATGSAASAGEPAIVTVGGASGSGGGGAGMGSGAAGDATGSARLAVGGSGGGGSEAAGDANGSAASAGEPASGAAGVSAATGDTRPLVAGGASAGELSCRSGKDGDGAAVSSSPIGRGGVSSATAASSEVATAPRVVSSDISGVMVPTAEASEASGDGGEGVAGSPAGLSKASLAVGATFSAPPLQRPRASARISTMSPSNHQWCPAWPAARLGCRFAAAWQCAGPVVRLAIFSSEPCKRSATDELDAALLRAATFCL